MISSGKSADEQCRIVGSGDGSDRTAWSRTQVGPLLYESPAPVATPLSFSFVFEAVLSVDYREVIFLPIRVSPSASLPLSLSYVDVELSLSAAASSSLSPLIVPYNQKPFEHLQRKQATAAAATRPGKGRGAIVATTRGTCGGTEG